MERQRPSAFWHRAAPPAAASAAVTARHVWQPLACGDAASFHHRLPELSPATTAPIDRSWPSTTTATCSIVAEYISACYAQRLNAAAGWRCYSARPEPARPARSTVHRIQRTTTKTNTAATQQYGLTIGPQYRSICTDVLAGSDGRIAANIRHCSSSRAAGGIYGVSTVWTVANARGKALFSRIETSMKPRRSGLIVFVKAASRIPFVIFFCICITTSCLARCPVGRFVGAPEAALAAAKQIVALSTSAAVDTGHPR